MPNLAYKYHFEHSALLYYNGIDPTINNISI